MSGSVSCRALHIFVISLQTAAALQLDSTVLRLHNPFYAAGHRLAAETVRADNHVLGCVHPEFIAKACQQHKVAAGPATLP